LNIFALCLESVEPLVQALIVIYSEILNRIPIPDLPLTLIAIT
jgi:hypothetical protein